MSKFCKNCGRQLDGERFCTDCGTAVDQETNEIRNTTTNNNILNFKTLSNEQKLKLLYVLSAIPPIVYLILLFCKWFKISIPYIGNESYGIYDFFSGINRLFALINGGAAEIFTKMFAIIFIILGLMLIYNCVQVLIRSYNHDNRCIESLSIASIVAIIESCLAIIFVLISNTAIKYMFKDIGLEISSIIAFTKIPVMMLIFSIIGKVLSDKLTYQIWKCEKED